MTEPNLFLHFVNDIIRSSSDVKLILFADDTAVFGSGNCLYKIVNFTNEALRKAKSWLEINRFTLNEDKTHFFWFSIASNVPIQLLTPCVWRLL